MVNSGSLAMIIWELGQARKGAAVLMDSCAEMWLEFATITFKVPRFCPTVRYHFRFYLLLRPEKQRQTLLR